MATTITVKNIPAGLYARLKRNAAGRHRSINSEIIALIEEALTPRKVEPKNLLTAARALREKTARYQISQKFIARAKKHEGRP